MIMATSHYREPTVECVNLGHSIQQDFSKFKSCNATKRVFDPTSELYWTFYESNGTKNEQKGGIVLLHGICGTAGSYFYLFNRLADLGFHCISAQYPEYLYTSDWITGFLHFLEFLNVSKPCVFASDLGGFLLQLFIEKYPDIIGSIILCNSYRRTDLLSQSPEFRGFYGKFYSLLPHIVLRGIYLDHYISTFDGQGKLQMQEQLAREFMANELDSIEAGDLGSRISLQLSDQVVPLGRTLPFPQSSILIIETRDTTLPTELSEDLKNRLESF
ncbi:bifunctional Alpha-Beta hydrolase fold/Maspardin [Babesia duncani]|uniref:Maspardin n=1 Tax=Babesia duncani TaxID=323732 RepID=A0AAD9PLG2_9APIC|nr:bifunctional Alpha-Beta hydrolase fold/Maspardin [Babesia duncani]